jgi:hypothetical protein
LFCKNGFNRFIALKNRSKNLTYYSIFTLHYFLKHSMHMRKFSLFFLVLLLGTVVAIAQSRVVTGRVLDSSGEPVPGASVVIKGANTGASANADGQFRITAKPGDVLVVTATNFSKVEVSLTDQTNISVNLARGGGLIEEVVVTTALGIRRQPKELGYATARIGNKDLTQATPVNIQNGLVGKVSGLNVAMTNNGVFGDTRITLRGIRSLLVITSRCWY